MVMVVDDKNQMVNRVDVIYILERKIRGNPMPFIGTHE